MLSIVYFTCIMQVCYNTDMVKRKETPRSDCPINYGVEAFGDKWSLLILRDILFYGKKTYGEFLSSDEHIATNILANRLGTLEQEDLIRRKPHLADKRKDIFSPTQKTIDMIPMLLELVIWSTKHGAGLDAPKDAIRQIQEDRAGVVAYVLASLEGKYPPLLMK